VKQFQRTMATASSSMTAIASSPRPWTGGIGNLGLRVLKTPPHCPQSNAICERVLGTLRREALDFVIPLTENHLRRMLRDWVAHDNQGRPHMSLGPGIPQPPVLLPIPLHRQS